MKKRAPKKKAVARPIAAKKSPAKAKKPATKAAPVAAAKAVPAAAAKAAPYNPAPLKGDGWPPFRYPLQ